MEKFTLINKDRSRIKVFEPFEDVSKPSPSIDAMMISYGCVYKRSIKPVIQGSRVETLEAAIKRIHNVCHACLQRLSGRPESDHQLH